MAFKTLNQWKAREKRQYHKRQYVQDTFPLKNVDLSYLKQRKNTKHKKALDTLEDENYITYSIWDVGNRNYSITLEIYDTNFSILSEEHKIEFFKKHWKFLNSFEKNCTSSITVCNRYLDDDEIEEIKIDLMKPDDKLNIYREDMNEIFDIKARTSSRIRKNIYLTITATKDNFEEARLFFNNVIQSTQRQLIHMGIQSKALNDNQRFKLLRSILQNPELKRSYDIKKSLANFDWCAGFAPNTMEFKPKYFKTDDLFGRAFYISDFPPYLTDSLLIRLSEIKNRIMLTIDFVPVPTSESMKQLKNINTGIETNISEFTRKQNKHGNFNASIPPDLEEARENIREMYADIQGQNQIILFGQISLVVMANTLKDLKQVTAKVTSIVNECGATLTVLQDEQENGLNTVLPFGVCPMLKPRVFITESASVFQPYNVADLNHSDGIYYGTNSVSGNMLYINRSHLPNSNAVLLGTSGSGKSFIAKREILQVKLKYKHDDIFVIDPEREYAPLINKLGGTVVVISPNTKNHINPLDIPKEFFEMKLLNHVDDSLRKEMDSENIFRNKNEFVLSFCEVVLDHNLSAEERSVIDRCCTAIYDPYLNIPQEIFNDMDKNLNIADKLEESNKRIYQYLHSLTPPTLKTFYDELRKQEEEEAHRVALAIELYVTGSMNIFAQQTNVDDENKVIAFDILELKDSLKTVAMLVVLEFIQARATKNRFNNQGKSSNEITRTWIYIDEAHVLLTHKQSADYLFNIWKRMRKYAGVPTAITQNIPDLLENKQSVTIFSNSDLKIFCKQSDNDKQILSEYMDFNDAQMEFISNQDIGGGALVVGNEFIPFKDKWDSNSLTYKLMSTKPGESEIVE